jgi:tRNAThr (cytosine32-N3)-methyltransferase
VVTESELEGESDEGSSPSPYEPPSSDQTNETESPPRTTHPLLSALISNRPPHERLFTIDQLGVDRRLIVNRKRQLKMYRVWMQAKFKKSLSVDT